VAASLDNLLADIDGDNVTMIVSAEKIWRIHFVPEPQILLNGNTPLGLFGELQDMGELLTEADTSKVPSFDQLTTDECFISWTLWLTADVSYNDILGVFASVVDECVLDIQLVSVHDTSLPIAVGKDIEQKTKQQSSANAPANKQAPVTYNESPVQAVAVGVREKPAEKVTPSKRSAEAVSPSSSIRVGIDKVDNLINLVGELVITQSMLSELGGNFDMDKLERLINGLEQLQQNTRELQESVMRIRMLPISFAFNRFPRMIRDLSVQIGKKVELILSGEDTELDKTVMEKISDPMVHLVRNAVDHGIESPEKRLAAGKQETGTIHLNAFHRGGNIVIEIIDDGNGLDADLLYKKALEKGIISASTEMTEQEVFELIFAPGFSTTAVVSDISGRGVGMDVVRRNITALGGRIEIDSKLGRGSTFRIHLPLTLAILDGQLVRVGTEVYVVPLVSIVESLQIKKELVNTVSGNMMLYRLREDNVSIIQIYQEFSIVADNTRLEDGLLVVVEGEGQKIGLLVDDLLSQQQVVIKSLKSNYKNIDGVSGATILGDGSVSMILDIPGLIRRVSDKKNSQKKPGTQHQEA
jgi:two-component system chemotaxis sensor kinase CheA